MNNFKKDKYLIIKNAISKEIANFIFEYFLYKKDSVKIMFDSGFLRPDDQVFGHYNDPQVLNSYSHYGDMVMETLLMKLLPKIEKESKTKLVPCYSYARIYEKGNILKKHIDRPSCEISVTLNLGGDMWPIFIKDIDSKNIKVKLNPGDLLMYRGCELEHWRESFKKNICIQVFLHYNDLNGPFKTENLYDTRPYIGLPGVFKKK